MSKQYSWEILNKEKDSTSLDAIIDVLLSNRGIKTKKEREDFLNPKHPKNFTVTELGIDEMEVSKALKRIKKAIKKDEHILVYGDYDCDGVCSTAIMWQTLYSYTKHVTPYLPDRFIDGYGLHPEAITKLKAKDPQLSLIVTVDNGIVAHDAVTKANELGIDVVITDHHQKGKSLPKAHAIIHTDMICGSGVAWVLGRELVNSEQCTVNSKPEQTQFTDHSLLITSLLDLTAIGTIADQMPLIGINRSFAMHGIYALNTTSRPGLLSLFETCAITAGSIGTYEINYMIAPRINAMGRLENAMDSLRLMCTTNGTKARELANTLGKVNFERQKKVTEMLIHAKSECVKREWQGVITVAHETYHEGVIGLIASRIVEEYHRPTIVLSKGETVSKASARSIYGFNIIEYIRKLEPLLIVCGGHPMAAGFSIENTKIDDFINQMEEISKEVLTQELLERKLRVDMSLPFEAINTKLIDKLSQFNPVGIGNPTPLFVSKNIHVEKVDLIGKDKNHIKMKLTDGNHTFDAIAFNFGEMYESLSLDSPIDIAYSPEMNVWNGKSTIQLKIRDVKVNPKSK